MLTDLTFGMSIKLDLIHPGEAGKDADSGLWTDGVSKTIVRSGVWERGETEVFLFLLRTIAEPSDLFVDVGAHIGYYTLMAGAHGLRTIAFEPVGLYFDRLRNGIAANGAEKRIHAIAHRISDKLGGGVTTLDKEIKRDASVFMIKLDCVGGEPRAVKGAAEVIGSLQAKTLMVEMSLQYDGRKKNADKADYADMCATLVGAGYQPFDIGRTRSRKLNLVGNPLHGKDVHPLLAQTRAEYLEEFQNFTRTTYLFVSRAVLGRTIFPPRR